MNHYFFNIKNGGTEPELDSLGEELPDDASAWREALRVTRQIEDSLAPGGTWQLEVRRDVVVFVIEIRSRQLV